MTVKVAIAGIHGHGAHHVRQIASEPQLAEFTVAAVIDPRPLDPAAPVARDLAEHCGEVAQFESVEALLAARAEGRAEVDIVVLATPIPTHLPLAAQCLAAGVDVLLEKPPTVSLAEYEALERAAAASDAYLQIGFQSFGFHGLATVKRLIADGEIGSVQGIGGFGAWRREVSYYERAAWAGRRRLNGHDVVDGVITNPLAHCVAAALNIAGARAASDIEFVHLEQFHAHDIEADDTSTVVMRARGLRLAFGLTLCAGEQSPPEIVVHGETGRIVFRYTENTVELWRGETLESSSSGGYTELLANLAAVRSGEARALLADVGSVGGFMRVMEAVRTAPPVRPVPDAVVTWHGEGGDAHPVIAGIETAVRRVAYELITFEAQGLPWALPEGRVLGEQAGGAVVHNSGEGVPALLSPRPFLHPVTTPRGTVVSGVMAADHDWHLGFGLAIQDVDGNNLWGGRTCTAGEGYVWLPDHGRIDIDSSRPGDTWAYDLAWRGANGAALLRETRTVSVSHGADALVLRWRSRLVAAEGTDARGVGLGSPATDSRPGAGYGGFFARLALCDDIEVNAGDDAEATHVGEAECMGARTRWLRYAATARDGGRFALTFTQRGDDLLPWFVRASGYPGVGLSVAYAERRVVTADAPLVIAVDVAVADA
ncbi:PmoA family protein [Micrococcales bacterium 31B]|nr:PmoA family protein [Micrococcales bacterium 31B]